MQSARQVNAVVSPFIGELSTWEIRTPRQRTLTSQKR
jgi:hypothetical protein